MTIFNIGFTGKTAEEFFTILLKNNVRKIIDTRLNNVSQLASFSSAKHLPYLLKVHGIEYEYKPELAPTKKILDDYKNKKISWNEYEKLYTELIHLRLPKDKIKISSFNNSAILCSEKTDEFCHRRLACEYIKNFYKDIVIKAL